jgi:transcriptional regulator of acetoin/glycerol metabolism
MSRLQNEHSWDGRLAALRDQVAALDAGVAAFDESALRRSWRRCIEAGLPARNEIRLQQARQGITIDATEHAIVARVADLLAASVDVADAIVIATDAEGTVVHAAGRAELLPSCWRGLLRRGTSLAEPLIGTSAPTLALIECRGQTVIRDAHCWRPMQPFYCTAVPLAHPAGGLLGALDISGYGSLPAIDALGLLRLAADRIEDELVRQIATAGVMELLPLVAAGTAVRPGLIAVNREGRAVAVNAVARRWLRTPAIRRLPVPLSWLLGGGVGHIERAPQRHRPHVAELQLPTGALLMLRYGPPELVPEAGAPTTKTPPMPPPRDESGPAPRRDAPAPATLSQARVKLVRAELAECGGNVSQAARRLGISRNSIYRWLQPSAGGSADPVAPG